MKLYEAINKGTLTSGTTTISVPIPTHLLIKLVESWIADYRYDFGRHDPQINRRSVDLAQEMLQDPHLRKVVERFVIKDCLRAIKARGSGHFSAEEMLEPNDFKVFQKHIQRFW